MDSGRVFDVAPDLTRWIISLTIGLIPFGQDFPQSRENIFSLCINEINITMILYTSLCDSIYLKQCTSAVTVLCMRL